MKEARRNGGINMIKKKLSFVTATCLIASALYSPNISAATVDKTKPTIMGVANKIVKIGQSFNVLKGVKARDNKDGDITKKIKINYIFLLTIS